MVSPTLHTERLRLRPRTQADVEANVAMDLDPAVHRYILSRAPDPQAHRADIEGRISAGWPERGGFWVIERLASPGFLGWCALFVHDGTPGLVLAYRLTVAAWGHGYVPEAARAVLDHAFREMGCDIVTVFHHPENVRSRRVIEKLGFLRRGYKIYLGDLQLRYELSREDWVGAPAIRP